MEEKKKKQNSEERNNTDNRQNDYDVKSQDHESIKKIANFVGSNELTSEQIEEKLDEALKNCYKMIEKKASDYLPVNADLAEKNRLISNLQNNAKLEMFNRVLKEGVDNIEVLSQSIAMDAVKPIVPIEDKGEKPLSKEELRKKYINEMLEKDLYSFSEKEEKNVTFQDEIKKTIRRIDDYKNYEEESKDLGNVIEVFVNDDIEKILDSDECDNRTRVAIASIVESESKSLKNEDAKIVQTENICKLLVLDNEFANNYAKNLAEIHEFDIFDYDENGIQSINMQKAFNVWKEETAKYYEKQGMDVNSKDAQESLNVMCSEETINKDFDSNLKLYEREHPELIPKDGKELKKIVEKSERQTFFLEQIYHNDGKSFEEEVTEWISGNVESAQKFLDEDCSAIDDQTDKINQLREIVKKVEKDKLKETFLKDTGNFEEEITNLVKINPETAQEFLKEFISNPESSNVKNYNLKLMTLQESINLVQGERTVENKEKFAFPNVENADISAIIEGKGPTILDDKQNDSKQKLQEDDGPSL